MQMTAESGEEAAKMAGSGPSRVGEARSRTEAAGEGDGGLALGSAGAWSRGSGGEAGRGEQRPAGEEVEARGGEEVLGPCSAGSNSEAAMAGAGHEVRRRTRGR